MNKIFFFLGIFSSLLFAEASNNNGTGLQTSVAGDIAGRFGKDATNRLDPREAEFMFYAPVDQTFDAQFNGAAHYEDGELHFELHELFVGSSKLIPRSRFKLGKYFLGVGRLNPIHRHDWPFTSAPKVQTEFFDRSGEGLNDTGVEYGYLLPTSFYLDLTLGVTNGWTYGHAHDEGAKPFFPVHYARLATYQKLSQTGGMQVGLNYLGRRDAGNIRYSLLGLDFVAKWREAQTLNFLLQSELWYQWKSPAGQEALKSYGAYVFPQYGFNANWYVGIRLDAFKNLEGNPIANFDYGFVPTLTYKASEFSTIRASYQWLVSRVDGQTVSRTRAVELQAIFLLGSHPAHDF